MNIWTTLSPEWQQFLVGAAGNALGGLAATFVDSLLRTVGRRVGETFRLPPRQQALERAAETAITAVIADWQIPNPDYQDLWDRFGAWLLNPAVLGQFRVLLTPSADSVLDVELLYDEFTAAGLEVDQLGTPDFDALVQDMVGAFYLAAAEEAELQEPLKIGLLREMAERMGALTRLAEQQTSFGGRTVQELQQLNLLAVDVADGIGTITDLLQAILQALPKLQQGAVNEQQIVYKGITDALSSAGRGDLIYAEVGSNGQNVAVGQNINMTVGSDLARVQQVLEEIRNSLAQTQSGVSTVELQAIEQNYCQSLIDQFDKLTFRGISPSGKALSLDLEKVYVELKAVADVPEAADTYSADERRFLLEAEARGEASRSDTVAHLDTLRLDRWRAEARGQRESSRLQRRSIGEIVGDPSQRGLVILGDPGSGKSTLLHYLALTYARRRVDPTLSPASLTTAPLSPDLLPIFVPFAAYDDHLRRTGQAMALGDFLALYYEKWRNLPGLQPLFQAALDQGRALLLLDGLDEVLETTTRQHVAEQAGSLIQQWTGRGNRCVVTSRVVGYREARLPGNLPHVTVLDFSRAEIENFAHQWCRTYEVWAAGRETPTALQQAAVEEKALLDDVRSNTSVEQLAASPLLLTMLAILRRQVGKLPDRRVELYAVYVRTLIDNREQERSRGARQHAPDRFDPHRAIAHLIELALWLQLNRPSGTARRQDLEQALVTICLRYDGHEEAHKIPERARVKATQDAEAFLQDMRHFAGLLGERGRDAFGFLHLTFQEYFAGRALAKLEPEARWQLIQPCLHQPRWREPILLCAGQLGVIEQRRDHVSDLAQRILNNQSQYEEVLSRDLLMAARMAADNVGISTMVLKEIYQGLVKLQDSKIPTLQNDSLTALAHLVRLEYEPALQTLVLGLEDRKLSLSVMRSVSSVLGEQITIPLRQAITSKLNNNIWQIRYTAVMVLGKLVANDIEVCHAIVTKLDDDSWQVRQASVNALAELISHNTVIRGVITNRLTDKDLAVRQAAIYTLAKLIETDSTMKQWFLTILYDQEPFVRQAAVQALAKLVAEDQTVCQAIIARFDDEDFYVVQAVMHAVIGLASCNIVVRKFILSKFDVMEYGNSRSIVQVVAKLAADDISVRQIILGKLNDENADGSVRCSSIHALADLVVRDEVVRRTIIAKLDDYNPLVSAMAIKALDGVVANDSLVLTAITKKLDDQSASVRLAAAQALTGVVRQEREIRASIIKMLSNEIWHSKLQLAEIFINDHDQELSEISIQATFDALNYFGTLNTIIDLGADIRKQAATILGQLDPIYRDEKIFNRLARVLDEDKDPQVRDAAYGALLRLAAAPERTTTDLDRNG